MLLLLLLLLWPSPGRLAQGRCPQTAGSGPKLPGGWWGRRLRGGGIGGVGVGVEEGIGMVVRWQMSE